MVYKDTDGGSDPALSYPSELSCFACNMTVLVYVKMALIGMDQPCIPLGMCSSPVVNLNNGRMSVAWAPTSLAPYQPLGVVSLLSTINVYA